VTALPIEADVRLSPPLSRCHQLGLELGSFIPANSDDGGCGVRNNLRDVSLRVS
jgi:hypothetical protein